MTLHKYHIALETARTRCGSTLLDQVTLVMAKTLVACWAKFIASAWGHAFVTFADRLAVLIISLATAAEECRQFDSCSTHLHMRSCWIAYMLGCECCAFVQGCLACTVA